MNKIITEDKKVCLDSNAMYPILHEGDRLYVSEVNKENSRFWNDRISIVETSKNQYIGELKCNADSETLTIKPLNETYETLTIELDAVKKIYNVHAFERWIS